MYTTLTNALAVAAIGVFARTGAFAADRLNANNNRVVQSKSRARAKQTVDIGVYE